MIVKIIYTGFLGLLIAFFVGLGIDAFRPGPVAPKYPIELETSGCPEAPETTKARKEFQIAQEQYDETSRAYNRTVSTMSLAAAILLLAASLTLISKIKMIADGVLLGGSLTTLYSIIRALMSEDSRFRFLIITVGLIIALVLGYLKFVRQKQSAQEMKPIEKQN